MSYPYSFSVSIKSFFWSRKLQNYALLVLYFIISRFLFFVRQARIAKGYMALNYMIKKMFYMQTTTYTYQDIFYKNLTYSYTCILILIFIKYENTGIFCSFFDIMWLQLDTFSFCALLTFTGMYLLWHR